VKLFNIMVHVLQDTTRHAGHADIDFARENWRQMLVNLGSGRAPIS
jgi:hypothetical protein